MELRQIIQDQGESKAPLPVFTSVICHLSSVFSSSTLHPFFTSPLPPSPGLPVLGRLPGQCFLNDESLEVLGRTSDFSLFYFYFPVH
jgi:hypothetical protein